MRKDYSLKPLHCEHLVVGAGSTGLAVVDHLLRREQGSVILVDSLDSPQAGPTGGRTPLLSPGEGNWSLLVDRARELYEGWSDWIEVDPQLRRCGVLLPRVHGNSLEALDSADSMRRWSKLSDSGPVCAIDDCAATVDAVTVASALMWRIRKAGGNFYPGSALSTLVEEADAVPGFARGSPKRCTCVQEHLPSTGSKNLAFAIPFNGRPSPSLPCNSMRSCLPSSSGRKIVRFCSIEAMVFMS